MPYEGKATPEEVKSYLQRIGYLIYPTMGLPPEISYAASIHRRFNQNPDFENLQKANYVLASLLRTKNLGIMYKINPDIVNTMPSNSDASFADDNTRRLTQAFLIKLFSGPIWWQSELQQFIVLSTIGSELNALTSVGLKVLSIRRLFNFIRFDPECDNPLLCGNQQTVGCIT